MRQDKERESIAGTIVQIVTDASAPFAPKQLVSELRGQGFREDKIRAVMWSLIDREKLRLTREWMLTLDDGNIPHAISIENHR